MRKALWMLALLLGGCLTPADQMNEAQALVDQLHTAMQTHDWDKALSLYHKGFFSQHSRDEWRQQLEHIFTRHGDLVEAKQMFRQKDARLQGDYYIFGYRLRLAHATVNETITIGKGVGEDRLRILAHVLKPSTQ